MDVNEVVNQYNIYTKSLEYIVDHNGAPQDKDSVIFNMIQLLKDFSKSVKETESPEVAEEVRAAVGVILDRDMNYFSENVCDFVRLSKDYTDTSLAPDTIMMLYNRFSKNLHDQLPQQGWGKETKYIIYNSLMELDKMVIKYAKDAAARKDIERMSQLIELTSGDNLNIPIVFQLVNVFGGLNPELDKKMESIMSENKLAFAKWSITRKSSRTYDLLERPSMMSSFLKGKVSRISERYGLAMQTIIDELLKSEGCKYTDIKVCGEGGYSVTYKIGGKVLKIGTTRETKKIPYHRRIIQPVLRQEFESFKDENGDYTIVDGRPSAGLFVEVTDRVEMNPEKCKGRLVDIFKEMYRDGVLWTDAKVGNVGILKRDNKATLGRGDKRETLDVDPVASGMYGKKKEAPLKKGDIVIIDTDFIYKVGDKDVIWGVDDPGSTEIAECKRWYEEQERKKGHIR